MPNSICAFVAHKRLKKSSSIPGTSDEILIRTKPSPSARETKRKTNIDSPAIPAAQCFVYSHQRRTSGRPENDSNYRWHTHTRAREPRRALFQGHCFPLRAPECLQNKRRPACNGRDRRSKTLLILAAGKDLYRRAVYFNAAEVTRTGVQRNAMTKEPRARRRRGGEGRGGSVAVQNRVSVSMFHLVGPVRPIK